ncbi:uncharacterized protein [Haliotis cracherodii]|uniref:uncharacterized protein n=1 Tax=Haliotis cracherodii TaxID=6455 RepID=UPI0039E900AB
MHLPGIAVFMQALLLPGTHQPGDPQETRKPPYWPSTFSVQFAELKVVNDTISSQNKGAWYYDYIRKQARFDHLQGQKNNFCQHQGLSDDNPQGTCHLIFSRDLSLYVHYPEAGTCCRLCGVEEGCTVLRPDWLKGSTPIGTEVISGTVCYGWTTPGAVANDTWFATEDNVPCLYNEVVGRLDHNLTFDMDTYTKAEPEDAIFKVPDQCYKDCPNPYTPPF